MANDPDRYAALEEKDWNMGPFYVLVDANTGRADVEIGHTGLTGVMLHRTVGPHFFENAKANGLVVRRVTITLNGPPIE